MSKCSESTTRSISRFDVRMKISFFKLSPTEIPFSSISELIVPDPLLGRGVMPDDEGSASSMSITACRW